MRSHLIYRLVLMNIQRERIKLQFMFLCQCSYCPIIINSVARRPRTGRNSSPLIHKYPEISYIHQKCNSSQLIRFLLVTWRNKPCPIIHLMNILICTQKSIFISIYYISALPHLVKFTRPTPPQTILHNRPCYTICTPRFN